MAACRSDSSGVTIGPSAPLLPQQQPKPMKLIDRLYNHDLTLATRVYQRFGRQRLPRLLWELFSQTGDGILWFLMVLPVVAVMWLAGLLDNASYATKVVFFAFYTCNFVDIVAIILLKLTFKRQRPPHHHNDGRFVGPDQHSFPSGHATRSWCIIAMFISLAETHPQVIRDFFHVSPSVLIVLLLLWGLTINFSRIALGRHYPSDVLAGSLIGFFFEFPVSAYIVSRLDIMKQQPTQ